MTKEEKNDLIFFYEDDCDSVKYSLKTYSCLFNTNIKHIIQLIFDLIKIKLVILNIKLFWKIKKFVV